MWEIREIEVEGGVGDTDLSVKQPSLVTMSREKRCLLALPEEFRNGFAKGCGVKVASEELKPSWGSGWREGFRAKWFDPDDKAKIKAEVQAAIDWLLEHELEQLTGGSTAENETNGKGDENMADEKKEIKAPEIQWEGRNITLPALPKHMAPRDAARVLLDKAKEEEQAIAIMEEIADAFPWDAAVQFSRAMGQLHGWGRAVGKQSFFGERPPVAIGVQTGPDTHEEVIWGPFRIPGMDEGELECGTSEKDGRVIFCIRGTVKKKDLPLVRALADLTRKLTVSHSIYRGKAIQMIIDDEGKVNWAEQPRFVTTSVRMENLIYDEYTMDQIGTHLVAPIVKREMLEKIGRPFGGAVLICGIYGTGKTVLAGALSNVCLDAGVTFIFVTSLKAVTEVLTAARPLGPTVVFVEDIDRISKDGERNELTQEIMNKLASITSRDAEVMAIFTTNKPGAIHPALIQRFGGLLSIDPPKPPEIAKLIRLYGRDLIDADEDLTEAAEYLDGTVPRTIEQLVQASKAYAVHRNGVDKIEDIRIIGRDIVGAAKHAEIQLKLSSREEDRVLTPAERFGQALEQVVAQQAGFPPKYEKIMEKLAEKLGL